MHNNSFQLPRYWFYILPCFFVGVIINEWLLKNLSISLIVMIISSLMSVSLVLYAIYVLMISELIIIKYAMTKCDWSLSPNQEATKRILDGFWFDFFGNECVWAIRLTLWCTSDGHANVFVWNWVFWNVLIQLIKRCKFSRQYNRN